MGEAGDNSKAEREQRNPSPDGEPSKPPVIRRPPPIPAQAREQKPVSEPTILGKPIGFQPAALLNTEELERFKNLLVFAKSTVEGYYVGKHKSPFHGASAEF